MISAFGVEHGEPVEKGLIGGTGRFFQGLAGKTPDPKFARKQVFEAGSTPGTTTAKPNVKGTTTSTGFNRGQETRNWMKKNPLKSAGIAGGSGLAAGGIAGAGGNEGYRRKYA